MCYFMQCTYINSQSEGNVSEKRFCNKKQIAQPFVQYSEYPLPFWATQISKSFLNKGSKPINYDEGAEF